MKIALIGYGKMGKSIEKIAKQKGLSIVYTTNRSIEIEKLKQAEVAIEFSVPEAAYRNISTCLNNQVPVVCGTTGWLDHMGDVAELVKANASKFLYASNFSIGVNIFFKLNTVLAKLMNTQSNYSIDIEEIHHTEKKDAPSGTAISLAEQIIDQSKFTSWSYPVTKTEYSIPIAARREAKVHGTHIINYKSAIDTISITHEAHSREGFAEGAILAAEWLVKQSDSGVYSMSDVLKL